MITGMLAPARTISLMALALACFVLAERHPDRRRRWLALMYVAIGFGVMTKGPIALVLPAMVGGIWLLLERRLGVIRRLIRIPGLLIVLAIKERRVWIEVGYALEQWITDGFAGETSRMVMAPAFRDGRYGDWLANNVDWSLSRERYWGTPLPIWECESADCGERFCAGSIADLRERGGEVPDDLHRPYIDEVTLRCEGCGGRMRRVEETIDALPRAQPDDELRPVGGDDVVLEGGSALRAAHRPGELLAGRVRRDPADLAATGP